MRVFPLTISLPALSAWIAPADGTVSEPDQIEALAPGLTASDLLVSLVAAALEPAAGELELLDNLPQRDDAQFAGRPTPQTEQLSAWLYAPQQRIAHAVHTPPWRAPSPCPPADQPSQALGRRSTARQNWDALLREHFHSGQGWTPISAVAMPLRVPFDEPGLKVAPLLALWPAASADEQWLSETMTTSIRHGAPHVARVQVFSAAMYLRRLQAAGHETIDVLPQQRTASLLS
jgi:hypothetical protein